MSESWLHRGRRVMRRMFDVRARRLRVPPPLELVAPEPPPVDPRIERIVRMTARRRAARR